MRTGFISLPKSVTEKRIIDNINVYDFEISANDMKTLNELDCYGVTGWDPTKEPL